MKFERVRSWLIAVGIFAAAATLAVVIWYVPSSGTFREGYLSSLLATLIGVAVAVPLGLGVDRWRQRAAEDQRRRRLLQAIHDDLVTIGEDLSGRIPRSDTVVVPFLGGGLWEAVSASGQINDITNPSLLRAIARAYDRIQATRYLERQTWELTNGVPFYNSMEIPLGGHRPGPRIHLAQAALADQDKHTREAIEFAIEQTRVAGGGR